MLFEHQSSVMVLAVVRRGITPEAPMAMFGVTVPDQKISVAPLDVLPVEKLVIVVPEAPLDGKSMFATGEVLPAVDAVQPPVVRAGVCLA
jgi:hypothetical protein